MNMMTELELDEEHDDDVAKYRFNGLGRLILETVHGTVIIDIRKDDVNSFVFEKGRRVDHLLIKP